MQARQSLNSGLLRSPHPFLPPCSVSEALGRFLFQQLVLALDFCHARGKVSWDRPRWCAAASSSAGCALVT